MSTQLNKVECNLTRLVLNVKYETSLKELKTLRNDFIELERGFQCMDAQIQFVENDKLYKHKIEFQQQIDNLKEKAILLRKQKVSILIYGIDDS